MAAAKEPLEKRLDLCDAKRQDQVFDLASRVEVFVFELFANFEVFLPGPKNFGDRH
jgi:hypothetical protein